MLDLHDCIVYNEKIEELVRYVGVFLCFFSVLLFGKGQGVVEISQVKRKTLRCAQNDRKNSLVVCHSERSEES